MKKLKNKIFLSIIILPIISIVVFASVKMTSNERTESVKIGNSLDTVSIDTSKVKLLMQVSNFLDFNATNFSILGNLTVHDGSDSTMNVKNATYCFIRKDSSFYYRLNAVEILNTNTHYIHADGEQKKLMISSHKHINPQFLFPPVEKFVTHLKEEKYTINEVTMAEGLKKISITNPHHIACKEYSLTFDEKTLIPKEFFVRLSNLQDPLNSKMDKTISLKFLDKKDSNLEELLFMNRLITKTDGKFIAINQYKGFEIINGR